MANQDPVSTFTFQDVFVFLRQGLVAALAIGVLAAAAALLLSRTATPIYKAESTVLLAQRNPDLQSFDVSLVTAPVLDVSTYRAALFTSSVLEAALNQAGTKVPPQTANALERDVSVSTEVAQNSSLIHIDVSNPNPERSAALANALATALVAWDKQLATDNLRQIITTLKSQLNNLDSQIDQLRKSGNTSDSTAIQSRLSVRGQRQSQLYSAEALLNSAIGRLSLFEKASPPRSPAAPRPKRSAVVALVLGILATYLVFLARNALDTRLRDSDDLAAVSGLSILAEFPRLPAGTRRLPREGARYLRTNLLFATSDAHPKVFLVTSPLSSEGKSSVALSLAESFARNDNRTLLVDADLRNPVLATECGLSAMAYQVEGHMQAPLAAHLDSQRTDLEPATVVLDSDSTLDVIPSYRPAESPTELLSRGFRSALERWRRTYDVIVIDSPPLLPIADTLIIAPLCTGTILTASMLITDRKQLRSAVNLLGRMGVRMLGVVATQLPPKNSATGGHGYGQGYGYGVSKGDHGKQSRTEGD